MVGDADETIRWIASNDERPELKRRAGKGAGRRMRGKFGLAIVSGHPPLSLRDISPSRGEIGKKGPPGQTRNRAFRRSAPHLRILWLAGVFRTGRRPVRSPPL